MDYLIFPAKTGTKKKKQKSRIRKSNTSSLEVPDQKISPLEEDRSDDEGESDQVGVTESYYQEPQVSEASGGFDDGDSEYFSVVRTKKKNKKTQFFS